VRGEDNSLKKRITLTCAVLVGQISRWTQRVEHVEIDGKVLGVPIICSLGSIKESG